MSENSPIYLDYCATTPIHPRVRQAMLATLQEQFGNPSSMHWAGQAAAGLVAQARQQVAGGVGCLPEEVFFTSGATEADNLALFGVLRRFPPGRAHLITTAIEHHAVLHAAQQLDREGYAVTILPVDGQGVLDPEEVRKALRPETVLVSVMLVNNEVGSIQPIDEIVEIAHAAGALVHTDAVQAVGLLEVNFQALGIDLLSLSAHKIYGPKGIGALVVRQSLALQPMLFGGAQEGGLRPGTENVPGIVGLGAAIELVVEQRSMERERLRRLREWFIAELQQRIPGLKANGPTQVAPQVLSLSFPDADAEMMLVRLSAAGVAASLGSACTSRDLEPSHVLAAMGLPLEQIAGTLRFSFGKFTTEEELRDTLELLPAVWQRCRLKG